ncbi:carbon-nitrogen hydrolase [Ceratobasidium sp. AG-I]|nr:carbon-nitrogen hydrolase [Ceratobasidium sp. AG-I]
MPQNLKVSVVQTCTAAYSLDDTLDKLERLVRLARERDGSQFCVFPEAFIGGYPRFSSFGAVIGSRTPEGRDEFLRYHSAAIALSPGSPARARIESVARTYGIFLVVGVIEKDDYAASAGTLYCTAVYVDPEQGVVGKHRKLMPTASERIVWGMGDGSTIPVLDYEFTATSEANGQTVQGQLGVKAKIAATICWENYMPLLRAHYYSKGVQLYCAPTVDSRTVWQSTMTHIALEGRCFVLSACQYAQQKDFPHGHAIPTDTEPDPEAVMIGGGSVIIGPLGDILAGPLRDGEGVLTAEIDLDDCVRGKLDLDVVGHYSRPDIFKLVVQE